MERTTTRLTTGGKGIQQGDQAERRWPSFLTIPRPVLKWTEPWKATARLNRLSIGYLIKKCLIASSLSTLMIFVAALLRGGRSAIGIELQVLVLILMFLILSLAILGLSFIPRSVYLYSNRWVIHAGQSARVVRLETLQKCLLTTCDLDGEMYPVLRGVSRSGAEVFEVFWKDSLSKSALASALAEWNVEFEFVLPEVTD